jgi:hypothetical protein
VDTRISYREGKQFVEYMLEIETDTRGTLFVWHRYSTFRNLAMTLQSKNTRKDLIPELPNKTLFGKFSDKIIQERIEKLNQFLEAATAADHLQWGIRIDAETCVYKRRVVTHHASSSSSEDRRMSTSKNNRESFSQRDSMTDVSSPMSSLRQSLFGRSKMK